MSNTTTIESFTELTDYYFRTVANSRWILSLDANGKVVVTDSKTKSIPVKVVRSHHVPAGRIAEKFVSDEVDDIFDDFLKLLSTIQVLSGYERGLYLHTIVGGTLGEPEWEAVWLEADLIIQTK